MIRLAQPALDLVLVAGERFSRIVQRQEDDYYPPQRGNLPPPRRRRTEPRSGGRS